MNDDEEGISYYFKIKIIKIHNLFSLILEKKMFQSINFFFNFLSLFKFDKKSFYLLVKFNFCSF
jgi:hypothetical protein